MDTMANTRLLTLAIAVVALGLGATLSAHHSFAAYYFEEQTIEVEGAISRLEFKAPHVWVHVDARDASGTLRTYSAEWGNPTRLERDGITKDTLRVDDLVRVWGSPGRTPSEYRLHLKRIQRPSDGWQWAGRQQRR
jgi:hypothetical protein